MYVMDDGFGRSNRGPIEMVSLNLPGGTAKTMKNLDQR
jgi:hypothetical protein